MHNPQASQIRERLRDTVVDSAGRSQVEGIPHASVGAVLRVPGVEVRGRQHFFCSAQRARLISPGLNPRGDGTRIAANTEVDVRVSKVPAQDGNFELELTVARNNGRLVVIAGDWYPDSSSIPVAEELLVPVA